MRFKYDVTVSALLLDLSYSIENSCYFLDPHLHVELTLMRWVQLRREGTGDVSLGKVIEPRKNTHEGRVIRDKKRRRKEGGSVSHHIRERYKKPATIILQVLLVAYPTIH